MNRQCTESPCASVMRSLCGHALPLNASALSNGAVGIVVEPLAHDEDPIRRLRGVGAGRIDDERAAELRVEPESRSSNVLSPLSTPQYGERAFGVEPNRQLARRVRGDLHGVVGRLERLAGSR